ncbi:MAG: hypothetical protein C0404_04740 [Verrucomicrobia bacterium]|nr:hypothetical protein [Verrucomicrobiota bacterium]
MKENIDKAAVIGQRRHQEEENARRTGWTGFAGRRSKAVYGHGHSERSFRQVPESRSAESQLASMIFSEECL